MADASFSSHLLVRRSQILDSQMCCVVVLDGAVVVGVVVGVTQGVPGTCHRPAESEHLSTWPFGERQSLACELSQVPGGEAA